MGWYLAGCACGELVEVEQNYAGDVAALHALGFDAAKFDNCGSMKNLTKVRTTSSWSRSWANLGPLLAVFPLCLGQLASFGPT
jgi:hypothetical protein